MNLATWREASTGVAISSEAVASKTGELEAPVRLSVEEVSALACYQSIVTASAWDPTFFVYYTPTISLNGCLSLSVKGTSGSCAYARIRYFNGSASSTSATQKVCADYWQSFPDYYMPFHVEAPYGPIEFAVQY